MSTIEERQAFLKNPYFDGHIYGDFTSFYITIAICAVLGVFLFAINIVYGCCSQHRKYWQHPHTGNRWLVALWTTTPHQQPPLDLVELEGVKSFHPQSLNIEIDPSPVPEYTRKFNFSQKLRKGEEFVELQKRESDI